MIENAFSMPAKAKLYLTLNISLGCLVLVLSWNQWQSTDPTRFLTYFLFCLLGSTLKVRLPGVTGTLSVNFLFMLLGVLHFSLGEIVLMATSGALVQSYWHAVERPRPIQVGFNVASMSIAVFAAYQTFNGLQALGLWEGSALPLVCTSLAFFAVNTISVSGILALVGNQSLITIWKECYFWSFPYYCLGACLVEGMYLAERWVGWESALLVLPTVFIIYRSYQAYLQRLELEKQHAEEMASLHLRTIESLALAIEAKDETTHKHLQRVRIYALEIGQDLGLSESELDALRAAALLHDIGKLAVPEHIISKPGRLSPEEFEKMKVHPVVGAEILEHVGFPYPVVPIVRSHHEKWDGSGYPDGLKGEEIPIGARILSAVDCLDALASHRQYRPALPLEQAMDYVESKAGIEFDREVVGILKRRYIELEEKATSEKPDLPKPVVMASSTPRGVPAAGYARSDSEKDGSSETHNVDFLRQIADARHEYQQLFEIVKELGTSLSLSETLAVLTDRLKSLVPHDACVVFENRDCTLTAIHAHGYEAKQFSGLEIPMNQGLVGWVAANGSPMVNGEPAVDLVRLGDSHVSTSMKSALAVPLEASSGVIGVLALYRPERDAFSHDNLRILEAISSKLALAVANSMRFARVEASATVDHLTGLPNARALFARLDSELSRAQRAKTPLVVLVCDLDGFKQVNDQFGHLRGNEVLTEVTKTLRSNCRDHDFIGRMGGDEFVILLPNLPENQVAKTVSRLQEAVAHQLRTLSITMSIGLASYPVDGDSAEQLLSRADLRMYRNKEQRRVASSRRTSQILEEVTSTVIN